MPFVVKLKAKFFDIDKFLNIDGIITPAIHSSNYGGGLWTIMILNNIAAFKNRAGWELLLSQFPVRSAA